MKRTPPDRPRTEIIRRFQDWASVRHGLMWAYEGPVRPIGRRGTWTHADPSCWLLRKGTVTVTSPGRRITATAGQWVFVATPTRTQRFSDDAEILSVHFHFTWPGGEPVIEQPRTVVFAASEQPGLEKAALPLARLVARSFPEASAFLPAAPCTLPLYLRVQNLVPRWLEAYLEAQAWLGAHPRRAGELDDRVLAVLDELDRQPLDRKFSESALVERAGLGRSRLNALFTRAAGLSPRRYYERRRLEACERLLANTGLSLKEIAMDLGFGSESHFSHWFRSRKGTTPSAFRQQAASGSG
ncbi:MAG: helix-turn-helix domain-containing protein [Verrucomicrobiota bacterium]